MVQREPPRVAPVPHPLRPAQSFGLSAQRAVRWSHPELDFWHEAERLSGYAEHGTRPAFTYDDSGAVDTVTVEFLVPSYPSPRWEVITFGKPYFEKWKQKSAAKFGGSANGNYTSFNKGIDPEFAGSKAIRHGLNKLGTNMNERNRNMAVAMDFKAEPITSVVKESSEENAVEDAIATVVNEDIDPTELC